MSKQIKSEDIIHNIYGHITHNLAKSIVTSVDEELREWTFDSFNTTGSFRNSFKSSIDMVIEKEIKKYNLPI